MQNIDLIQAGKMNAKYFAEGVAEYQKLSGCLWWHSGSSSCWRKRSRRKMPPMLWREKALEKEAKSHPSPMRKGAAIAVMCIEGRQISSDELAQFLPTAQTAGRGCGVRSSAPPHGLSDEVKKAAAPISMGRITMPHQPPAWC